MTEPLCDSCGEWTDPATLQDGDCPGCVAVRPDKTEQALDTQTPITPAQLKERGFAEPE